MERFKKEIASFEDDYDLTFTKDDKIETLKKIRENQHRKKKKGTFFRIGKFHIGPLLATAAVFLLAIGLFLPSLYSGIEVSQEHQNRQQAVSTQENYSFSAVLMGKDSTSFRSNINILLTYNSSNNSFNLVPIPRETYVEIFDSEGKIVYEDKLMHASAIEPSPKSFVTTVSNLFDFSIDYYSVIPEENIYATLEVDEDDERVNLYQTREIGDLIKEQLSITEIKNLLKDSETNIPSHILNQIEKSNSESIQVIDMADKGIEETSIDGIYYVMIKQELIENITKTLKKHLNEENITQ